MITIDFETRSTADLIKWGAQRYAHDASTQALCLRWAFDDDEDVGLWHRAHPWIEKAPVPEELLDRIASGEEVEAHNAGFEYYIWNIALMREFPEFNVPIKLEQLRCSAAKASCVSLPRALGDAVAAVSLEHRKNPRGRFLINKLSKPMPRRKSNGGVAVFSEDEALHRENWEYCGDDVRAERGLSKYCPEMSERELEYWRMDFRMNERGIHLDLDAAKRGIKLAEIEAERLNTEIQGITEGAVPGFAKRKPLLAWINAELTAMNCKPLPDTKADTFSFAIYGAPSKAADAAKEAGKVRQDAMWSLLGDRGENVQRVLQIAMEGNRSSVAKYRRMVQSVCPDGRLHDIMLYNGADRTGRWSGKGVQPHNFVRGYGAGYKDPTPEGFDEMCHVWHCLKHLDLDTITIMWGEPMVALAKAARGALTATPGKTLYAADFNAIEARKLAWLSNCTRLLTLFQTGGDPYLDMASAIYGRVCTKADKAERQLGKKAILGLGYAMGWEKFQQTVWMDEGIWLDDEMCMRIVTLYRKKMYPEVPALWKAAETAACKAVTEGGEWTCGGDELGNGSVSYFVDRDFLHCRLPSGRLLAYLYPEVHTRLNYRFKARNEKGSATVITFPVKRKNVPMVRVRDHAERLAAKKNKILLPDSPETFEQPHLSFMGRDTYTRVWKRCGTHGGTLVENFDQASSRDLLAEAMLRVDQRDDLALLLSIHDEVVAEGDKGACSLHDFEALMAEVPGWAPGMPISAEGWIGERLRK